MKKEHIVEARNHAYELMLTAQRIMEILTEKEANNGNYQYQRSES